MSSCKKILEDIGASKEEIAYIDKHIKGGLESGEITEKVWQDIENMRFRKQSDELSKSNTIQFLDKLNQVVKQVKKPYKTLFKFLVGDKYFKVTSKGTCTIWILFFKIADA